MFDPTRGINVPSQQKKARQRIKQYINENMNSSSANDFTVLIFIGIAIGLVMSIFNTPEGYTAAFTVLITSIVLPFLIHVIPKFIGVFKKQPEQLPPSFYLAKGINGEAPKVKRSARVNRITMEL